MLQAIANTQLEGLVTNLPLHQLLLQSEEFVAGTYHTNSLAALLKG
jgi:biotin carboxylase